MALVMKKVSLIDCIFKEKDPKAELKYCLGIDDYQVDEKTITDGFIYSAKIRFNLMKGIRKSLFTMQCSFEVIYEGKQEDRERLKEHIVVAHAVTYLREFVSNITMRTTIPVLFMAPVNAVALWQDYTVSKK